MNEARAVPIGELAEIVGGGTPNRSNPDYFGGDIPWVTPKDMKSWIIDKSQICITRAGLDESAARLVEANSILIVVRSGVLKHTLPVGLNRLPVAINQDMKAIIPSDLVDPAYLARYIKAKSPEILSWVRATTADNFPIDKLKALKIPLPPMSRQRRAVDILDRVDALHAKRREALIMLGELERSAFLDTFGNPSANPHGFPGCELAELVPTGDRINYGVVQPGDHDEAGVPIIRVGDLADSGVDRSSLKRISPLIERQYSRSRIRGNELLVSCVGSIGSVSMVGPEDVGSNIARAVARVPVDDDDTRQYLMAYLRTEDVRIQLETGRRSAVHSG
ncbi:restriction endonuclease subunit S [Micromonospora sp. NPDC050695]|uniref:restriction endonuclease subunit S n=1 Tax=Micromonospora sp. NPDC050695 TaxID=3154938 RepID=UPI003407BB46